MDNSGSAGKKKSPKRRYVYDPSETTFPRRSFTPSLFTDDGSAPKQPGRFVAPVVTNKAAKKPQPAPEPVRPEAEALNTAETAPPEPEALNAAEPLAGQPLAAEEPAVIMPEEEAVTVVDAPAFAEPPVKTEKTHIAGTPKTEPRKKPRPVKKSRKRGRAITAPTKPPEEVQTVAGQFMQAAPPVVLPDAAIAAEKFITEKPQGAAAVEPEPESSKTGLPLKEIEAEVFFAAPTAESSAEIKTDAQAPVSTDDAPELTAEEIIPDGSAGAEPEVLPQSKVFPEPVAAVTEEKPELTPAKEEAVPPTPAANAPKQARPVAAWLIPVLKYVALLLVLVPFILSYLAPRELAYFLPREKKVLFTTDKDTYLRYGYITIEAGSPPLNIRDKWLKEPLYAGVFIGDKQLTTIGGLKDVPLKFDTKTETWKGRFPIPWNPLRGQYSVRLLNSGLEKEKEPPQRVFTITKRELPPLKKGFAVLTLEYSGRYAGLTMKSPSGEKKPAAISLAEWAVNLKTDALWVLVGKTTGTNGKIWDTVDFEAIRKIGAECHKRGIQFGVWGMCYLTFPDKDWLPYQWAYDLVDGKVTRVRSVSLLDPKRPDDIADLLSKFRDMPEVDYLGLDYIRNALGGYEMCEEFYKDMWWVNKPAGWDKMNHDQRVAAFAKLKIKRDDRKLTEAWEWWRAEKVAQIVHHIKSRLGDSKMMWTYTLGWDKGWQHGQDPAMIVDAGSDIDAVMLYEADQEQYGAMMRDWAGYLDKGDTRLVVGEIVDAPLHQGKGSREFARRLNWAADEIYGKDSPAEGVFIHDLGRLLYGRKGGETTADWVNASRDCIVRFKKRAEAIK